MSIKVGQLRKNSGTTYLTPITTTVGYFENQGLGQTFQDFSLKASWSPNNTYYVKLKIKRINIYENMGDITNAGDNDPHNLNIDIKLYKDKTNYQTIGEPFLIEPHLSNNAQDGLEEERAFINWCNERINSENEPSSSSGTNLIFPAQMVSYFYNPTTISIQKEQLDENDAVKKYFTKLQQAFEEKETYINNIKGTFSKDSYEIIELVFTPYLIAEDLVLELRRVAYDYNEIPRQIQLDGEAPYDITVLEAYRVNNILPSDLVTSNNKRIKKIGIQTKPGNLVVVNSAPMRVGKSGIMEIDVGVNITSVGFAAAEGKINDFILDYMYKEE